MSDDEMLKAAFDLIAASKPSDIADEVLWYNRKADWVMEYARRMKAQRGNK